VWAGELSAADRARALDLLKLPASTGPAKWWLTEFEDPWPYRAAPGDLYFARAPSQAPLQREPVVKYTMGDAPDATWLLAGVAAVPVLARRRRQRSRR
jgi:hypothetical protein